MSTPIPDYKAPKTPGRVYLDIRVHRGKRFYAVCNGHVASIPKPHSLVLIEEAVRRSAQRAFCDYWDRKIDPADVVTESETRGFEYLASTARLAQ